MKSLGEVLQLSVKYLQDKKIERPRRLVEESLTHLLGLERMELYMQFDRPIEEGELIIFRNWLKRMAQGEPIEYLTKEVVFYGCQIEVSPDVLIPRPETEILLDKVCSLIMERKTGVAWDLCCGSGCLGIALKKAIPELSVSVSDLSLAALRIAKKNIEKNQVHLEILQGDLLHPFKGRRADFVLCNPPYVSESEYVSLQKSVRDFEPKIALVSGPTGLEFYDRLSHELPPYLNPGAKVFLEIGASQGEALKSIFSGSHWKTKCLEKDWSGHDRFFFLEFE